MGYVSAAVYNAAVAIRGGYSSYGAGVHAPKGASMDAAVIEAAYDTLVNYFPLQTATLYPPIRRRSGWCRMESPRATARQ